MERQLRKAHANSPGGTGRSTSKPKGTSSKPERGGTQRPNPTSARGSSAVKPKGTKRLVGNKKTR